MRLFLALILVLFSAAAAEVHAGQRTPVAAGPSTPLAIARGTGTVINLPRPGKRIFVADPAVADVEAIGNDAFYIFGVGTGSTTVVVTNEAGLRISQYSVSVFRGANDARGDLRSLGLENDVGVSFVGNRPVLSGNIDTPAERRSLEVLRGQLDGENSTANLTQYTGDTQIRLDVRIVEVQTAGLRKMGLSLDNLVGTAVLSVLARQGIAQILAEPVMVTADGQPAKLFSGGEFAFTTDDETGAVDFRRYGVSLEFTPELIDVDTVAVQLNAEFSAPAGAQATSASGVPGRNVRSISNTLEMNSGKTYVIGGLFQQSSDYNEVRIPGLADVPLVGGLFRNERLEATETELVVLITPRILGTDDHEQPERQRVVQAPVRDIVGFTIRSGLLK